MMPPLPMGHKHPLGETCKEGTGRDNTILLKLEGNNPAGSVKDRPALNMIRRAAGKT